MAKSRAGSSPAFGTSFDFYKRSQYATEAVLVICDLAKMEKGEPTVAVDLLVKPLLAMG